MNKIFTIFNLIIVLGILTLGSIAHLMYGHCQTSKIHFMCQAYWMPGYLPKCMIIDSKFEKFPFMGTYHLAVDKNYTGIWYEWYKSGAKQTMIEYINGKANGIKIEWYKSGTKNSEGEYKGGKLNGKEISWNESGAKMEESEYKDGNLNGKSIEWDEKSNKTKEEEYKDGKMIKDYLFPVRSK